MVLWFLFFGKGCRMEKEKQNKKTKTKEIPQNLRLELEARAGEVMLFSFEGRGQTRLANSHSQLSKFGGLDPEV